MLLAHNAVIHLNTPVREAARLYGVPQTTLKERVTGKRSLDDNGKIISGNSLFDKDKETVLVDHIQIMQRLGFPCNSIAIRRLAMEYAVDIGHRNIGDMELSEKWLRNFRHRNPDICVRDKITEAESVAEYFGTLSRVYQEFGLFDKPDAVYFLVCKILGERKTVKKCDIAGYLHDNNHISDEIVTLLFAVNVNCLTVPPFFIFPGASNDDTNVIDNHITTENGRLNSHVFTKYYTNHLVPSINCTDGNVVVIYDASSCHVPLSLATQAHENGISFVPMPYDTPNAQPITKLMMDRFDSIFQKRCKSLTKSKRADITKANVIEITENLLPQLLTPQTLTESFSRSGIFPLNPTIHFTT